MVHTSEHPIFYVTADVVCLTVRAGAFQVLLVERGGDPYRGRLALPGGFVLPDEDLDSAARRELREETAITAPPFIEQLATYGAPGRDPRGRIVSVAYLAIAPDLGDASGGSDAAAAAWYDVNRVLQNRDSLAFDHHEILEEGVRRARGKLEYSPLAPDFCPPEFTIAELRKVYEIVWDIHLDPANFHRKVTRAEGFLEKSGTTTSGTRGRPAQPYRKGDADRIHPPLNLQ